MKRPSASALCLSTASMSSRRGSARRPGKAREDGEQVNEVVPDQGDLELAEVRAHVKHVGVADGACLPEAEQRCGAGAAGGAVTPWGELGQNLEHGQVGIGAGIVLAPGPRKLPRADDTAQGQPLARSKPAKCATARSRAGSWAKPNLAKA